eukprot:2668853-Prymnesium_polylepis.1
MACCAAAHKCAPVSVGGTRCTLRAPSGGAATVQKLWSHYGPRSHGACDFVPAAGRQRRGAAPPASQIGGCCYVMEIRVDFA